MKPEREKKKRVVSSTKPGPKEREESFISGQTGGQRAAATVQTFLITQRSNRQHLGDSCATWRRFFASSKFVCVSESNVFFPHFPFLPVFVASSKTLALRLLQRVEAVSHVAWSSSEDVRWLDRDCPQCRDTRNACGLIGEDGTEWGTGSSVGEKERSPGAEL